MSIENFFKPKSVAVVGVSDKPGSFGNDCARNTLSSSTADRTYFVNPKREELLGKKCYKSIFDLPEVVDCVALCTPAATVNGLLKEAAEFGIKNAIVFASGFAEDNSKEGIAMEEKMVKIAKEYDMKILGPNGLGFFNNVDKIYLWGMGNHMITDRGSGIGIIAQSGFIAANLVFKDYFNISYAISTGNGNVFTLDECMEFLVDNSNVKVVALYLEGIKNAEIFTHALAKAARLKKPVVILKAGTSSKGAVSAASHTGSLAGSTKAYEAVFEKFGVTQVESLQELMTTAQMYSVISDNLPKKAGIAGINLSGGENTICADLCEKHDVELPDLQEETLAKMRKYIPAFATAKNPLDGTTSLFTAQDNLYHVICVMGSDPAIGSVIFGINLGEGTISPREQTITNAMRQYGKDFPKEANLFAVPSYEDRRNKEYRRIMEDAGIPIMSSADIAYRVLGKLGKFIRYNVKEKTMEIAVPKTDKKGLKKVALTEYDSKAEMIQHGILVPKQSIAKSEEELIAQISKMEFPLALKINSPDILHKTEAGGVCLNIKNQEEAISAYHDILKSCKAFKPDARLEGILVQEMAKKGMEIIIGVTNDPQFGPMILVGLGGVFVEVFKDVSLYPCPINKKEALIMIKKLKAYKLLAGYRGSKPCDIEALADMMVQISDYATKNKEIVAEMDLNPVFVYPKGEGVTAVDALIVRYEK